MNKKYLKILITQTNTIHTRAGSGRPIRWLDDTWAAGLNFENEKRDKEKTKREAAKLHFSLKCSG